MRLAMKLQEFPFLDEKTVQHTPKRLHARPNTCTSETDPKHTRSLCSQGGTHDILEPPPDGFLHWALWRTMGRATPDNDRAHWEQGLGQVVVDDVLLRFLM